MRETIEKIKEKKRNEILTVNHENKITSNEKCKSTINTVERKQK